MIEARYYYCTDFYAIFVTDAIKTIHHICTGRTVVGQRRSGCRESQSTQSFTLLTTPAAQLTI